jgi:hypothetical protein
MSEYEPQMWACNQCKRVVGVVVRGSDRRSKLHVLRHGCHVDNADVLADVTKIRPAVILEAGTVVCGWCGAERTWSMSEQALDDLLARRKTRGYGLEVGA